MLRAFDKLRKGSVIATLTLITQQQRRRLALSMALSASYAAD